jgi:hypothetical protein
MKYLKNIEIVSGLIWAASILLVSLFSSIFDLTDYNWLVLTTAAGFHISFLSDRLQKERKGKPSKC